MDAPIAILASLGLSEPVIPAHQLKSRTLKVAFLALQAVKEKPVPELPELKKNHREHQGLWGTNQTVIIP